jgi:hypothetical protein
VRRHFFPDVILYRDDILRFCLCEIEGVEVPDPGQLYYGFQVVVDAQVYVPVVATAVAATFPGAAEESWGARGAALSSRCRFLWCGLRPRSPGP